VSEPGWCDGVCADPGDHRASAGIALWICFPAPSGQPVVFGDTHGLLSNGGFLSPDPSLDSEMRALKRPREEFVIREKTSSHRSSPPRLQTTAAEPAQIPDPRMTQWAPCTRDRRLGTGSG
jgi:hypothetical protein